MARKRTIRSGLWENEDHQTLSGASLRVANKQTIFQPMITSQPPLERKTYTIEEAAEVLGVGRNMVLKLIADKRLRTVSDIGKRVLIPVVAIDEFLAA